MHQPQVQYRWNQSGTDQRVKAILQEAVSVYRVDAVLLLTILFIAHHHSGPMRGLCRQLERRRSGCMRDDQVATENRFTGTGIAREDIWMDIDRRICIGSQTERG